MRGLYAELLPCFTQPPGEHRPATSRSSWGAAARELRCEEQGKGRVYLEYLLELVRPLQAEGRTVQFWGDIIGQHRELIPELPRERLIALAWGYEAPLDPGEVPANITSALAGAGVDVEAFRGFEVQAKRYTEAGIPFMVCPGTSSWLSLVGRVPNALAQRARRRAHRARVRGARAAAHRLGRSGAPAAAVDLAAGARVRRGARLVDGVGRRARALRRRSTRWSCAMRRARSARRSRGWARSTRRPGIRALNSSPLAMALLRPWKRYEPTWGRTDRARLDAIVAELERTRAELAGAKPLGFGGALVARELAQAAALARHGAFRLMHACLGEGPSAVRARRRPRAAHRRAARVLARAQPPRRTRPTRSRGSSARSRSTASDPRARARAHASCRASSRRRSRRAQVRREFMRAHRERRAHPLRGLGRGATPSACSRSATCRATSSSCSASPTTCATCARTRTCASSRRTSCTSGEVHARLIYKDGSLLWRCASHFAKSATEFWIGKGDLKLEVENGFYVYYTAEHTTDLPLEMQMAVESLTQPRRAACVTTAVALGAVRAARARRPPLRVPRLHRRRAGARRRTRATS